MKSIEKYFEIAFSAPDGIKKLREMILKKAMQGKLVPQDSKDEDARVLEEKLIKLKKNRVSTKMLELKLETEYPFELPSTWKWTKLGMITDFSFGKTPSSGNPAYWSESVGDYWAAISDLPTRGFINTTHKRITKKAVKEVFKISPVPTGSLLMSFKLSIGKTAINEIPLYHNEAILSFSNLSNELRDYLFWFLGPLSSFGNSKNAIKGNTLNSESLNNLLIPLPPAEEQVRIVNRVRSLMKICDELENLCNEKDQKRFSVHSCAINALLKASEERSFNIVFQFITSNFSELYSTKESVAELKKAILQLAITGKLVPQNPKDKPASELLREIEAMKLKLIKNGKIKKQKPLLPIIDKDIPCQLPIGWEWGYFFSVNTARSELVDPQYFQDSFQIAPDIIEKDTGKLIGKRTVANSEVAGPNNKFYKGQILYSKIRPSLNKVVIAPYDGLCSADMYPIDCYIDSSYMQKVMLSELFLSQVRKVENRIKMPKINLEALSLFLIPIPPDHEQKRIVAKIDSLFMMCEELERKIEISARAKSNFLSAVMV